MKKVVIAGGTGFIGSYLVKRFTDTGHHVLVVSRQKGYISWDTHELQKALEGADLVINLAGKSINCRHNSKNKRKLVNSRIQPTIRIGEVAARCKQPPVLWINASAAGVYKPSYNFANTEMNCEYDTGFLADLVLQWESVFFGFNLPKTRQVALRTSVVLGKGGGALTPLKMLTRLGLGGKHGDGKQLFSWIHIEDYFRILLFLIENEDIQGIVNCTSPKPVKDEVLMQTMRDVLQMQSGLPASVSVIRIVSFLIGTESSLLLNSSYLLPARLTEKGFNFAYGDIHKSLKSLFF